jgi:signal transduction histidine kinase
MSSDSPTNNPQFSTIEAVFASQVQLKHELRSSLNAIIGYSEMLWQDTQDSGQNELHLGFKRLHKAGQRLLNTTNTVLEASRLATGTLELSLDSLVAKLRHHLRTPIDEFIAV